MKLYIKYMVSIRCKLFVKEELRKLGLHFVMVNLGEVEIMEDITPEQRVLFQDALMLAGLELIDDKKAVLIENIKKVVVEMVHYADELPSIKFSNYLSEKLHYDYTYMANLFSCTEGVTLEHFIVLHKIEKVKELIMYDEMNMTEIAWKLQYSSVAHLSNQFKKVTGLSPSHFKHLKVRRRSNIEDVGNNHGEDNNTEE